jgi:hypothetical protein
MKRSVFNESDTMESILHDWNLMTMNKANQMMEVHNKDENLHLWMKSKVIHILSTF